MTELFFRTFFISTGESMRVNFGSDSVDIDSEVMIGNGSISSFNGPQWLWKSINSGSWIDYNLSTIQSESHPMQRMMSSVTNVTSDSTELSLENWMTTLSFHIISWFVEISNSWNMTFLLFTQNVSMIININWSVVKCLLVLLSFQYWWNNDHVVFPCKFSQELNWLSVHWFRKLHPWVSFPCTHKEWSIKDLL